MTRSYIVIGSKPWSMRIFRERIRTLPGKWRYSPDLKRLSPEFLKRSGPRYIFFLHWSEKVPESIIRDYECVGFHMTDLPFGRGGSPLQNLISRGYRRTRITAFRMITELDAGPVYGKEDLSLEGNAEEIYIRATEVSARMVESIVQEEPRPVPQRGRATRFRRRAPGESEIGDAGDLESLYDFLRMLDAEGYPKAFLVHRGFRYEFSRSVRYEGRIVADVTITREGEP